MSSEADTFSWAELRAMMRDRFVDHPLLAPELKFEALALQAVRGRPLLRA